jgi:hypothetical protein
MTERRKGDRLFAGVLLWLTVAVTVVSGCDSCRPQRQAEQAPIPAAKPNPAVVTGSIRLAPGHELPKYRPEDMERRVLAHIQGGTFPDVCSPPKLNDRTPVRQSPDGKLIGVMVAASEFSKSTPRDPIVHEVVIKDCRLTPSLVVAQVNDTLRMSNEVNYPLLPTYGANAYNETLVPGQTKSHRLDKPGVDNVLCGFTAPCGRTDVVTIHHPVYAISDATGTFRIESFPTDETVKLSAWHPLFSEASVSIKVASGETKTVELVLTPLPPQPETPVPDPATETKTKKGG